MSQGQITAEEGSSPLTRGKLSAGRDWTMPSRLIPAHAGKTAGARVRERDHWAHPRSRGENFARVPVGKTCAGSSPLTRGKRLGEDVGACAVRLIPAHAGKTVW